MKMKTGIWVLLLAMLAGCGQKKEVAETQPEPFPHKPHYEYGIMTDTVPFCIDVVERDENLSEILSDFNVPYPVIHEAAEKSKEVFDVRKIKSGNPYCVIREPDSLGTAKYFVYEKNPVDYVVFEFGDSVNVYMGEKEVTVEQKVAAGVIDYSLWNTMTEQDLNIELILKLSEIYAWIVDFYHIQKGDAFKVYYEEKYVEGGPVGVGRVNGALFNHYGKDYYAFYFEQDTVGDYFDEKGGATRRAFLKAPLKYSRISSRYNPKRFHPILKRTRPHLGTDYAAPTGTPIMAVSNGRVIEKGYGRGNGNYVKIYHNSTYTTQYLHMSKFGPGIKKGVQVAQGQVIGYVGSTGLATGPHLCYRFWKNGKQVDPLREEFPPAEPIKAEYLATFLEQVKQIRPLIDSISYPEPAPPDSIMAEATPVK